MTQADASPYPCSMTPDWFSRAIARPAESQFAEVAGTKIHYLCWNAHETHKPGLLLAHGFRAHARWWSFTAPYLTDRFRVVALDFAGMGDSGNRETYTPELFGRDILGVLDAVQFQRATLIGHSFGGSRVLRACADHPERVERAVVIDSYVPLPEIPRFDRPPLKLRPKKIYPSYEAARARFRLVPEHNCATDYVLDYVGQHSLRQTGEGWSWKFDDGFTPFRDDHATEVAHAEATLRRIPMPVHVIYGEHSIVMDRTMADAVSRRLPNKPTPIEIPESHHHVLLDQPLPMVAALRTVLGKL